MIKGTVANHAALPTTGNALGDLYITADTGHGWSWTGTTWIDVGPIQGPKGDTGNTGATGQQGNTGLTGPKGDVGQVWRGTWSALTGYNKNDAVEYQGSTYIATASSMGEPPISSTGAYWAPPLATTGARGSVPALSPSAQASYILRGDNTWQVFSDLLALWTPPPSVGTIVQSAVFSIQSGGASGAIAGVYAFQSSQGAVWGNYSFTPKYANSLIRASFSLSAQINGAAGWGGWALFTPGATYAFAEAWGN